MKYLQNLHQHSTFCDGKDTPEEVVITAISRGFDSVGFSSHSPTPFPEDYNLNEQNISDYIAEIHRLKEKYSNDIAVHLGIELDRESTVDLTPYDYIISASHYVHCPDGSLYSVDYSLEVAKTAFSKFAKPMDCVKNYYENLSKLKNPGKPTFVAHFDLVTKFQNKLKLFEDDCKEYRDCALDCLHTLAKKFDLFEINTGAVSRGYHELPYPASFILKELKALDKGIVIASDCHNRNNIDYAFDLSQKILKNHGFNCHYIFKDKDFISISLD